MISVIMPVYNVEDYVAEAIESVKQQSYGKWELLLIDDGSTDASSKICKVYSEKDKRIRYIRKENGGVSSARNRGLLEAAGEWIYFMDADDWLDPKCFKTAMEYQKQENVDIVSWNYYRVEGDCSVKALAVCPERFVETVGEALIREILFYGYGDQSERKHGSMRSLCMRVMRASMIKDLKFFEDIKIGEDALFCAMSYQRARKAVFLNEYLYYYRKVSSSADQRFHPDIEKTFENLLKHTYEFLEEDTNLSAKDTCYTGLVYDCMARALEKKFVHRENPAGYRERILQIRRFANDPWVRAGIWHKFDGTVFKKKQKAVLFCMRFRLYQGLYLLQKIKEWKKNKRSR